MPCTSVRCNTASARKPPRDVRSSDRRNEKGAGSPASRPPPLTGFRCDPHGHSWRIRSRRALVKGRILRKGLVGGVDPGGNTREVSVPRSPGRIRGDGRVSELPNTGCPWTRSRLRRSLGASGSHGVPPGLQPAVFAGGLPRRRLGDPRRGRRAAAGDGGSRSRASASGPASSGPGARPRTRSRGRGAPPERTAVVTSPEPGGTGAPAGRAPRW